jgi:hypothetical protein
MEESNLVLLIRKLSEGPYMYVLMIFKSITHTFSNSSRVICWSAIFMLAMLCGITYKPAE